VKKREREFLLCGRGRRGGAEGETKIGNLKIRGSQGSKKRNNLLTV
jgi:hypothetical protein